jgi:hypothetical protein
MTLQFHTIEEAIAFHEAAEGRMLAARGAGLEAAGVALEHAAKAALGEYQAGAGPFPAWEELAERTKEKRGEWGWGINEPLLVTDELRNHIRHSVDAERGRGAVGVPHEWVGVLMGEDPNDQYRDIGEVALVQEMGLGHVPQRSFLGLSAVRHFGRLINLMVRPVVLAFAGVATARLPAPEQVDDEIPW